MAAVSDFISPEEAWRIALDKVADAYRTAPSSDAVKGAEFALHCAYRLVTDTKQGVDRF